MNSNYSVCIKEILKHEGGYVNHPQDPGGATNYGITIAVARQHWNPSATAEDMKNISLETVNMIYKKQYWDKVSGDSLPEGIDLCTFDSSVNSGVGRADDWLSYGLSVPAGKKYAELAILAQASKDKAEVVRRMCDKRLSFLHGLKTWSTFGKGWGRRVEGVRAKALGMVATAAGKDPVKELQKEIKTIDASVKESAVKGGAIATGSGATAVGYDVSWLIGLGLGAIVTVAVLWLALRILSANKAKAALKAEIMNVVQERDRATVHAEPVLRDVSPDEQADGGVHPQG